MSTRGPEVRAALTGEDRRAFMRHLLADLHALETLIDSGAIERDVRRAGAEQEVFLVDRRMRPSPSALDILERLPDPHFTTELGLFNLEVNLDALRFGGRALARMESQLTELLDRMRSAATRIGVHVVLAGILPTLRMSDLSLANMTPHRRYRELNAAMGAMRGGAYEFHIRGLDELLLRHDTVMLEACNASFQAHLQVGAEEFANLYNVAQVVTAPVLAAAGNSPLLFGRQLWAETRIALFQQAVDTRRSVRFLRERSPRVTFGTRWVRRSALELYREDVARFRTLVAADGIEDSRAVMAGGGIPRLDALRLYNGTVYRWNRACYGITEGKPHLRIENRVLPSGPTVIDQVANAALWYGLLLGLAARHEDVAAETDFADAKMSFEAAARLGLEAPLRWFGATRTAAELIGDELLPLAREGLVGAGIDTEDADRYLGVIERRVRTGTTGARWAVQSMAQMRGRGTPAERLVALTAAVVARQREDRPVSEWEPARIEEATMALDGQPIVEQYMTTDLFTVTEDEPIELVASLMAWHRIRHVPVEDDSHRLVGLVSYRSLLALMACGKLDGQTLDAPVSSLMKRDPVTIGPDATILDAMDAMRTHRVACLPVVHEGALRGVITERDLIHLAAETLRERIGR
jgi:CBS domain-containing protein/gamma-glutamyl:cysteine ligase YbdK (ATP-grasp superfamily)